MTEESALIRRVRKLLKLAQNNPSAEESAAAAAKAQALIEKHRIDAALLAVEDSDGKPPELQDVVERVIYQFAGRRLSHWVCEVARGVCKASGLFTWYGWNGGRRAYWAAGPIEDLVAAEVLTDWLVAEVGHLLDEERRKGTAGYGRSWANSFRMGCAYMIGKRLREEAERKRREATMTREERYAAASGDAEALLALDSEPQTYGLAVRQAAVELIAKQTKENARVTRSRHKFGTMGYSGSTYGGGYASGVNAGKRARINAPGRIT